MKNVFVLLMSIFTTMVFGQKRFYKAFEMPKEQYGLGLVESLKFISETELSIFRGDFYLEQEEDILTIVNHGKKEVFLSGRLISDGEFHELRVFLNKKTYYLIEASLNGFFVIDDNEGFRAFFIEDNFDKNNSKPHILN